VENNKFLAILLGILLFNVGLAGAENIQKPWNDGIWENNHEYIWNLWIVGPLYSPFMESPVSQLYVSGLDALEIGDDAVSEKVFETQTNANYYLDLNRYLYYDCNSLGSCSFDRCIKIYFDFETGEVIPTIRDIDNYGLYTILDFRESVDCFFSDFSALELDDRWKSAMNSAVESLELSADNATETVGNARAEYNKLKDAGLCEDRYTWNPGNSCRELQNAINAIDSGDEGSVYGKINGMRKNIDEINKQVWESKGPNMSLYYPTMEMIWDEDGIVPLYSDLTAEGEAALGEAEDIYDGIKHDADDLKEETDNGFASLKSNNLDVITESKISEGVVEALESGAGTIAEKYEEFGDAKETADGLYEDSIDAYTDGDIADATIGMDDAKTTYEALDAEAIVADAEAVVLDKKEEADEAIENAESYIEENDLGAEARAMLADAEEKRDEADSSTILGDRYLLYKEAAEIANSVAGGKTADEELSYSALVAEIEGLLSDAEKDLIDVADLRLELDYVKTAKPANCVSRLESIKLEIVERAELAYGYLQNERDVLYDKLVAAGADNLLSELEDSERGLVYNGKIDYLEAVGDLKTLGEEYERIAGLLEDDEHAANDAIANQLVVETSLLIGDIKIDDRTDVTYVVTVMNPKSYGGYEIEVRVPINGEFSFMYSDVVSGSEDLLNVRTEGSSMYLLFGEIDAFEREVVSFEKSAILARTRSIETEAVGLGDGTARVDETILFELDINDEVVEVPSEYSGALIDGLDPNRPLREGIHSMTNSYIEYDAYTETRTDAVVSGTDTRATVSYEITINPEIDLIEVPVFADIGTDEYISDVSIECGMYDCVKQNNGGNYAITVYGLMEGLSATVSISYSINNLDDYITLELDRYRSSKEAEIQQLIDEAEAYLLAGNNEAALQKLEEIKKKVSELEKEKAKLLKKYYELVRKINNEIEDLGNALTKSEELGIENNTEVMKLETRKQTLEDELSKVNISDDSTKDEIQSAVDDLEKIDMNWLEKEVTAISKQAGKDFENYKKEFAEYENANATSLMKQLETDINVLLATDKATDMVIVISDLEKVSDLLEKLEGEKLIELESMQMEFDDLKDTAEALLVRYESEYNDAKKYGMDSIFPITPKSVSTLLSQTEKLIESEDIAGAAHNIEEEIPEKIEKMQDTLKLISSNAYRKLDEIDYELEIKRGEFSGEQIAEIEKMKSDVEASLSAGSYVQAIKKAGDAITYIKNTKGKGNTALYLVLASLLIVAALGGYLIYQKKKKPKMRMFGKEKLEKSADEKPQEPEKEKPASL